MWAPAHGQGVAGGVSTGGAPELAKSLCLDCIKVLNTAAIRLHHTGSGVPPSFPASMAGTFVEVEAAETSHPSKSIHGCLTISTVIQIRRKDISDDVHFSLKHVNLDHLVSVGFSLSIPVEYRIRSLSSAYTPKNQTLPPGGTVI
uniref:Uncharacterized protein n=1 Tax=Rangifer tarandus platyrhynchus TaxID=3082113 RepID=A0ACB0E5P1_RANTA|nr:unnamed protein product [Rangifer tarandus platyrhynchus]